MNKLIKSYCRESGVRNLRKHIEKIFRKAAFLNVSEGQSGITISKSNLQDFVGKPVFSQGMHDFLQEVQLSIVWLNPGFNFSKYRENLLFFIKVDQFSQTY